MRELISMIPLSSLKPSKRNVRKTDRSADIAALAKSIKLHGLLQNLTVRETGTAENKAYEVVAGGRRLAALKLLLKRKAVSREHEVPCRVLTDEDPPDTELSLVENELRVPLHPADQFEAFSKLQAEGLGPEDIAARFGVTPAVVLQRLKLASVSPRLMAAYRKGDMTLDQLMAFTVSDDHAAQKRVWFDSSEVNFPAQSIRRALTAEHIGAGDRRARCGGAEAYEGAGGVILRDLFRPEDEGYFTDSTLLDRLVSEKLSQIATQVAAEGWQWLETRLEVDYEYLSRFDRLPADIEPPSEETQQRLAERSERYDKLVAALDEESSDEALAEIDALEAEIDALSAPRECWNEADRARGGVFIAIDYHGAPVIVRGLLKSDPGKPNAAQKQKRLGKGKGGIPDALREELSAHRTAALRIELSRDPKIAFRALMHTLVLRSFYGPSGASCVEIRPVSVDLRPAAEGITESAAMQAFAEQHMAFRAILPQPDKLWTWLETREAEENFDLLAHCVAGAINALWLRREAAQDERLAHAEALAHVVDLDMAKWWQPTRLRYFDHLTKEGICSAVEEGVSKQAAHNIVALKKGAMATRAEELLKESNWLPGPLRNRKAS